MEAERVGRRKKDKRRREEESGREEHGTRRRQGSKPRAAVSGQEAEEEEEEEKEVEAESVKVTKKEKAKGFSEVWTSRAEWICRVQQVVKGRPGTEQFAGEIYRRCAEVRSHARQSEVRTRNVKGHRDGVDVPGRKSGREEAKCKECRRKGTEAPAKPEACEVPDRTGTSRADKKDGRLRRPGPARRHGREVVAVLGSNGREKRQHVKTEKVGAKAS